LSQPPRAYRLASTALALPLAGYTLSRSLRDGGGAYLHQRYGFSPDVAAGSVCIHCASVGEVAAAAPLLRELDTHGIGPLVVSTSTPTGQKRARAQAPAGTPVVYLPLDRPGPVRRFLERLRPRAALIVETELWPHLFAGLAKRGVPIVLINGRLSARTLAAPAWWRRTAAWCLARVTRVLARSETDRASFETLGADPARLETVGNLKLAAPADARHDPVDLGARFVVAASTHDDEELQLARAWAEAGPADCLLALAPRHPERGAALARTLEQAGFTVQRRSQGERATAPPALYLADTLGELNGLIAGAEVVIMGGSLIAHGGQNVLEPARAARAIVTGPHMENFADETARLEAAGALLRCSDAAAVVATTAALLADAGRREAMGARGQALLARASDMAARYRQALVAAVPELAPD
jgi:3-deoxy-D-manno-octulosonic-acid transferase